MKRFLWLVLSLLMIVTASFGQPPGAASSQDGAAVLAPGQPPLTREMVDQNVAFFEFALDGKFTAAQRNLFQQQLVAIWKSENRKAMDVFLSAPPVQAQLAAATKEQRQAARDKLQPTLVQGLRQPPINEMARLLLDVYEAAHQSDTAAAARDTHAGSGAPGKTDPAMQHLDKGNAHAEAKRHAEAVEAYRQAIRLRPDFAVAYNNMGNSYLSMERYPEALDAFKQAIRLKADFVEALNGIGAVHLNTSRYPEAVEAYKEAIRLKPDFVLAYNDLGITYYKMSRYPEAIESFKQAARVNPDSSLAYRNLGGIYKNTERYAEAVEAFKQVVRLEPRNHLAYYDLAHSYQKSGRSKEALEALQQVVRLKPDYTAAHFGMGAIYLTLGDREGALRQYKVLQTLDPKKAEQLYAMIK